MLVVDELVSPSFSLDYAAPVVDVDRRQSDRDPCDLTAVATAIGGPKLSTLTAKVADVSDGGVGLATSRPVPAGTVLRLALRDARRPHGQVTVRVVHSTRRGNGWLVGCAFLP
jgi:hypothetical protein